MIEGCLEEGIVQSTHFFLEIMPVGKLRYLKYVDFLKITIIV